MLREEPEYRPQAPSADRLEEYALRPGTRIEGKYELVRPAGFGGMSSVWVAKNLATGAEVAVKLLLADRAASKDAHARFRREAHAAAALTHRGIVRVFDLLELSGPDAGSLALVMELLKGKTLQEHLDVNGKLAVGETLDIFEPVLSALAHAHQQGVVHRDLKPDNIFLVREPDGRTLPKLLDFGISQLRKPHVPRITGDGHSLGTPGYMSPEQARGSRDTDARSDVFCMGILLHECLSGANPFKGDSYHEVVANILEREPPPLAEVPEPLARVIERMLKKKPPERYADAGEALAAVRVATGRLALASSGSFAFEAPPRADLATSSAPPAPGEARDTTPDPERGKRRRRGRWTSGWRAGAAVAGALLAGVLAGFAYFGPKLGAPPVEPGSTASGSGSAGDLEELPAADPGRDETGTEATAAGHTQAAAGPGADLAEPATGAPGGALAPGAAPAPSSAVAPATSEASNEARKPPPRSDALRAPGF